MLRPLRDEILRISGFHVDSTLESSSALSLSPTSGALLSLLQTQDSPNATTPKAPAKDVINSFVKVTDPKVYNSQVCVLQLTVARRVTPC